MPSQLGFPGDAWATASVLLLIFCYTCSDRFSSRIVIINLRMTRDS